MVTKANKKLWILRRLKYLGAEVRDLVDIYIKQIRSILELAVPVWHDSITLTEQIDIERIQRSATCIILGECYVSYREALKSLGLESLKIRRDKLCLKFGKKAEKHQKFQKWFKPAQASKNTRREKPKYCSVLAKHSRFEKSPISSLTKRLNSMYKKQ